MKNETLDELVAAIQREISVNKPQAALDHLHTYCMKKLAHLINARGGTCDKDEALHTRAGKYIRMLEAEQAMQPISTRIMKSSISIYEEFSHIRNNKSFAHDNELVGTVRPHSSLDYRPPAPEAWITNNMGHGEVETATCFPLLHTRRRLS